MAKPKKTKHHNHLEVLPTPLLEVIKLLFAKLPAGVVLVGGTALSGLYFGHRRSDDIDLFTNSSITFRQAVNIINNLQEKLELREIQSFPGYFHALATSQDHQFTIDVVEDKALFDVMVVETFPYNIKAPDLLTLFKMKISTLVSRCGEKDLFDLLHLFEKFQETSIEEMIQFGQEIDKGVTVDNLCLSIGGTKLSVDSCDFSYEKDVSPREIFKKIEAFQASLLKSFLSFQGGNKHLSSIRAVLEHLNELSKK